MVRFFAMVGVIGFGAWAARAEPERCVPLMGPDEADALDDAVAFANVHAVDIQSQEVVIRYGGGPIDSPETVQLESVEVVRAVSSDDGFGASDEAIPDEGHAVLHLEGDLAALCGRDQVVVKPGDSLGQAWRVVSVGPTGLLLVGDEGLAWMPEEGAEPPAFDIVWESDFSIVAAPTTSGSTAKKRAAKKRKKRARKKRRRR